MTVSSAAEVVGIAAGCAVGGGALIWVLAAPLRRRSLRGALLVLGLLCLGATVAAVLGTAGAMFLSRHDVYITMVIVAVVAVIVSAAALLLSNMIAEEYNRLRETAARLGAGEDPDAADARPLVVELEEVRHSLLDASHALAEARQRERSIAAAQTEMLAGLSHDLRTPMAGIRAMAEALQDGLGADPTRYHARIIADVHRLTGMVDALFDLARPHADPVDTSPVLLSLSDIVSDGLASMDALAQARGVTLRGTADPATHLTGDPAEISRAVDNVLANALTATPRGGAVTVVLEQVMAADPTVQLTITDTCGGIPEADLPRVFDVGFRGSRPQDLARAAPGGAGFGLAVTRRIVESHHGTVSVTNTATGCSFRLTFPVTLVGRHCGAQTTGR